MRKQRLETQVQPRVLRPRQSPVYSTGLLPVSVTDPFSGLCN